MLPAGTVSRFIEEKQIMKHVLTVIGALGLVLGCSSSGTSFDPEAGASHLRLEIACGADSDCPAHFRCESETEHGATSTFCSSIEPASKDGKTGATCPAGYEAEDEGGTLFCKPHGGDKGGGSEKDSAEADKGEGGSEAGHEATEDQGASGGHDGEASESGDDHGAGGSDDGAASESGDDHGAGGSDDGESHGGGDDSHGKK